jgi:uncharacterized membrane protein YfcA
VTAAHPHTRTNVVAAAVVGVLAGFLSGLFGVGGGLLIVPGLVTLMRMPQRRAHGTSLAAIVPIASSGVIGYWVSDSVDWAAAGLIVLGAAVGSVIGTHVLQRLPHRALRVSFVLFLLTTAVRLLVDIPDANGRNAIDVGLAIGLVVVGLGSGTLAGLLGVGGGLVVVPALIVLFGVPDAVAKGTSLAVIIPTALVGTYRNLAYRNVELPAALVAGLFGVASAFVGSRIAVEMDPTASTIVFAGLLVAVAVRILLTGPRQDQLADVGPEP